MREIKRFLGRFVKPRLTTTVTPEYQYEWEKTFVPTAKQGIESVFSLQLGKTYRLHMHERDPQGKVVEQATEDFKLIAEINPRENLRLKRECIVDAIKVNPNADQGEEPYIAAQYNIGDFGRRMFTGTWQSYTKAGISNYSLPIVELLDPRWANWVEEIGDEPQPEAPQSA